MDVSEHGGVFARVPISEDEFHECATCALKPGSPTLCKACLWNRALVDRLHREKQQALSKVDVVERKFRRMKQAFLWVISGFVEDRFEQI